MSLVAYLPPHPPRVLGREGADDSGHRMGAGRGSPSRGRVRIRRASGKTGRRRGFEPSHQNSVRTERGL